MQSLQAASASPRCGAETAITTDDSPMATRPTRWAMATRAEVVRALELGGQVGHDLLGHALVGLVVEVENRPAAGMDAGRADEDRGAAGALISHLRHDGSHVERLRAEPEGAARDGRDERHLVAVGELAGRARRTRGSRRRAGPAARLRARARPRRRPRARRRRARAPTSRRARAAPRTASHGLAPRRK